MPNEIYDVVMKDASHYYLDVKIGRSCTQCQRHCSNISIGNTLVAGRLLLQLLPCRSCKILLVVVCLMFALDVVEAQIEVMVDSVKA